MDEPVAESLFVCVRPDGTKTPAAVRVHRPTRLETGEWTCTLEMPGFHEALPLLRGHDSLQALCLATTLARGLLEAFVARGGAVLNPEDGTRYPIGAVFGFLPEPPEGQG